jgi:hypothetical protein
VSAPGQIGQTVVQGMGNAAGDVANVLSHLGQGNFGGALAAGGGPEYQLIAPSHPWRASLSRSPRRGVHAPVFTVRAAETP